MKLKLHMIAAAVTAAAMAPVAYAQYYGGVVLSGGQARSEFGFNGAEKPSEIVDLNQLSRGLSLSNESSVGMKLGYRFTPYFSVEGRFAGSYADRSAFNSLDIFQRNAAAVRAKSMGLDLVGSLPIFKSLSLEGRAGFRAEQNGSESSLNGIVASAANPRAVNTGALGVGVQYNFNNSLGLRFEVERSRKFFNDRGNLDAESVTFGVHWRF